MSRVCHRLKGPMAPVIFDSGVQNNLPRGTLIATFVFDSAKQKWVYSGHCALFVGHRTDGERGPALEPGQSRHQRADRR